MNVLDGKSLLIVGGSGSFGTAFLERALTTDARKIGIVSRSEHRQTEMRARYTDPRIRWLLCDIRDSGALPLAMHGMEFVAHAAAMKEVPACESHPYEATETNVRGTYNVMRAALDAGVSRAVLLSTDKVAHPATLYGATKMCAERLWLASNVYAGGRKSSFACTRYGNVLGSAASVVPLWREQVRTTGSITVTDPNSSRFWMPMAAAVDLVLLAFSNMRGGDVFVPKVGSATVGTLADAIAPNVPAVITGLRAGEKLHEVLIGEDEAATARDCGDHYVIEPAARSWDDHKWSVRGTAVPPRFRYGSDTNLQRLSVSQLRALIDGDTEARKCA